MGDTEESIIEEKLKEWNDFLKSQGVGRNERRLEAKRMRKDLEFTNKSLKKGGKK